MEKITKKCAVCGNEISYTQADIDAFNKFWEKPSEKIPARFFDIWHYYLEVCPVCKYAGKDISRVSEKVKDLVLQVGYKNCFEQNFLEEINKVRPNNILEYFSAGKLYEEEKKWFDASVSYFQASDLIYEELMNFETQIKEEDGKLLPDDQKTVEELIEFSDAILEKGFDAIEKHISENPNDNIAKILYAGMLIDGEDEDYEDGMAMLEKYSNSNKFSAEELELVKFLKNS